MTPRSLLAPARLAGQPILRSQSDDRLVDLMRAGYDPAFEAIVARYRHALLRYARRLLDDERAEDAVQQAFVNAYDSMLGGSAELNLRPWLYRIVHNTALNALRDRALRHEQLDETIDGVERPDQAFERSEGLRAVVASVNHLPPRQRDALVLQAVEGHSYEEIAKELGLSDGSVRQLLNRARTQLRAGVTAITPVGLLTRIPWEASGEPVVARLAELTAGAGTGALVAKVVTTVAVTGAVAGGLASVEGPGLSSAREEPARQAAGGDRQTTTTSPTPRSRLVSDGRERGNRDDDSGRSGGGDDDRSGPGGGEAREEETEDRSGPGGGDDTDEAEDNSGPGSSGDGDGSSGPGSGEVEEIDSSGPGSGELTTTTETDDSGSGSRSDNSGEGSSGSGSSGSGSSGSSG